jgi:hypothetical protein
MAKNDDREWFSAKRFGYGSAMPCSWQGWLVTIFYFAVVFGSALAFASKPMILLAIVIPASAIFLLVAAHTTRGGWRWRWGEKK